VLSSASLRMTRQTRALWLPWGLALVSLSVCACSSDGEKSQAIAIDSGTHEKHDSGASDAATQLDASTGDAGTQLPEKLSETGLYAMGSTSQLAAGVLAYAPRYVLWSDGAEKQRWLYLPPGTQIDTSDMDEWDFPVGTKVWKEFSVSGKRLETRLLWKTDKGWFRMSFQWSEDGSDAIAVPHGAQNVGGTTHDVPTRGNCTDCHSTSRDMLLGVSAIQLSHDGPGVTLMQLAQDGLLTHAPSADFRLADTAEWNALGYLHANCGNCHNPKSVAWDRVDLDLWLRVGELSAPSATQSYKTTVQTLLTDTGGDLMYRVASGDPDQSGLVFRMTIRGSDKAMPPLASEVVDSEGVTLVRDWIEGL
jgi:hypothetical protein